MAGEIWKKMIDLPPPSQTQKKKVRHVNLDTGNESLHGMKKEVYRFSGQLMSMACQPHLRQSRSFLSVQNLNIILNQNKQS